MTNLSEREAIKTAYVNAADGSADVSFRMCEHTEEQYEAFVAGYRAALRKELAECSVEERDAFVLGLGARYDGKPLDPQKLTLIYREGQARAREDSKQREEPTEAWMVTRIRSVLERDGFPNNVAERLAHLVVAALAENGDTVPDGLGDRRPGA